MNEEKNENEVIEEVTETVEVENETKEKFLPKALGWVKRNGKKVVTGVAVTAGLGLAYALGKKSGGSDDYMDEESDDDPAVMFEDVTDEATE